MQLYYTSRLLRITQPGRSETGLADGSANSFGTARVERLGAPVRTRGDKPALQRPVYQGFNCLYTASATRSSSALPTSPDSA